MKNIKYIGISEINGPLIFLNNVVDVSYDEMVVIELDNNTKRIGKVVEINESRVAIQVFEGTKGLSLSNSKTTFMGEPLKVNLSKEILGRTFNGCGEEIDGYGKIFYDEKRDINGEILNPVSRIYPKNYINTGISSIDVLTTLIRGQKLPIFSGSGMSHNELAIQIIKQAKITDSDNFCIVLAGMGIKNDVFDYFKKSLEEAGVMKKVCMYINLANDPIIERTITPRCALTAAEYLAYKHDMHVLVILTDMTSYCEALREFSSSKGEIPGRKGYPGYLYSDLASIYERAGIVYNAKGSITQIPILTMPNDDITHPISDLTGYITEGQIVLDRKLDQLGYFPSIGILPSLSRLMKDGIGEGFTRADHQFLQNQLFASYAKVSDVRSLASVIGEDELSEIDNQYMKFGKLFEKYFINQGYNQNRDITESLDLGWMLLSIFPKGELSRVDEKVLLEFYDNEKALNYFRNLGELL